MSGETHEEGGIREHETRIDPPEPRDAGLVFIGTLRTPFMSRADCPRQGSLDGPDCRVEVFGPWQPALAGLRAGQTVDLLYWLDLARRDLVTQAPRGKGRIFGTFALRSPVRPNPIGLSRALVVGVDEAGLAVRGLDCIDGTPLLDIKPDISERTPRD